MGDFNSKARVVSSGTVVPVEVVEGGQAGVFPVASFHRSGIRNSMYNADDVDTYINSIRVQWNRLLSENSKLATRANELSGYANRVIALTSEVDSLRKQNEELLARLKSAEPGSYDVSISNMADELTALRKRATDLSNKTVAKARADADDIKAQADGYSNKVRTDADAYAESVKREADDYRTRSTEEADGYSDVTRSNADKYASDVRAKADKDAKNILNAASAQAAEVKAKAAREADRIVSVANSSVAAARKKITVEYNAVVDAAEAKLRAAEHVRTEASTMVSQLMNVLAKHANSGQKPLDALNDLRRRGIDMGVEERGKDKVEAGAEAEVEVMNPPEPPVEHEAAKEPKGSGIEPRTAEPAAEESKGSGIDADSDPRDTPTTYADDVETQAMSEVPANDGMTADFRSVETDEMSVADRLAGVSDPA